MLIYQNLNKNLQDSKILCNFASVKQRRPLPPNVNDLTASDVECVAASMSDVRILSNMIAPWIICGACGVIAGWFVGRSRRYKKMWKDLKIDYDKRCWELNDALVEKDRLSDRLNAIINSTGWYLTKRVVKSQVQDNIIGGVMVVMSHKIFPYDFSIKTFDFNPNDPEDRDFAIREAEELIETIKKF